MTVLLFCSLLWAQTSPVEAPRLSAVWSLQSSPVERFVDEKSKEARAYLDQEVTAAELSLAWHARSPSSMACPAGLDLEVAPVRSRSHDGALQTRGVRRMMGGVDPRFPEPVQAISLGENLVGARSWESETVLWLGPPDGLRMVSIPDGYTVADRPWAGVLDGQAYVLLNRVSGGSVVMRVDPEAKSLEAVEVVFRGALSVPYSSAQLVGDQLLVMGLFDGQFELRRVDLEGGLVTPLGIRSTAWISMGAANKGVVQVQATGVEGSARWRIRAQGSPEWIAQEHCPVVVETVRVNVHGVRVPVTLIRAEGDEPAADAPLYVDVYGGFGIPNQVPNSDHWRQAWVGQGGRYAVVHVRGGGERGPMWHEAGRGVRKVQTVLDLNAVVAELHARGLGVPEKTAVWGESNGGLVVTAAVARRPDLYGAVVAGMGPYDLAHAISLAGEAYNFEQAQSVMACDEPTGTARSWWHNGEYPSPYGGAVEREALADLSPITGDIAGPLPPVLLYTGSYDAVVNPMHSVRLAAAWQSAPGSPVLLQVHPNATHGPPPGSCYFGWSWTQRAIYEDAEAFIIRALELGPLRVTRW